MYCIKEPLTSFSEFIPSHIYSGGYGSFVPVSDSTNKSKHFAWTTTLNLHTREIAVLFKSYKITILSTKISLNVFNIKCIVSQVMDITLPSLQSSWQYFYIPYSKRVKCKLWLTKLLLFVGLKKDQYKDVRNRILPPPSVQSWGISYGRAGVSRGYQCGS